ncbi:FtsX-like permease family protein [Paenibacillus sp.]|jgi:putative ABC transport system permease protein|uniref:ABC transporter permease n=1 Tax=Paenibacillus sp. TaxID=58172 RepID=UPI0028277CB4|nr:FtsX-like permease family protein [Paenibacillus sp.]MDR0269327.1 FtsX-like permease family protein [Paenibacillus sp.]
MKIVNLAWANIKKGRGAAISLFILIFIAALLLNLGMTVISKMNTFYDDKVEELHDAHVSIIMNSSEYKQPYADFLKNYSGVRETETMRIILMNMAKFRYGDSDLSLGVAILNADASRRFSPMKLIEKLDSINDQDMYVPYSLKTSGGYQLGDNLTINYQDKDYRYRIAGFFEATMMGTSNTGMMKFVVPDVAYHQLSDKLDKTADGILMSASLTDSIKSAELLNDYNKQFSQPQWGADIVMMKNVNTMTVNTVAMILVAFAAVIVLVSLIVIKFRVTNSIDDGMVNIGVLKAVGYTSWQIIASMAVQFMLIALSASVIAVLISYTVMPVFGGIISSLSGLLWSQSFDIAINCASILLVAVLVLTATLISSSRIRKLHPVAALRGGIVTHNFKRNFFPLKKAKGGLHYVLACKTMIMNGKQNIMIAIIIAAITFASIFSIVLYYNVAVNKTAFIHLVGSETSNVVIQSNHDVDSDKLLAHIEQMNGVTKTALLDVITATIDGHSYYMNISDDYSKLNNNAVYKGRYPQYDNEIAISGAMAKLLHKSIGDTVKVEMDDVSRPFLITGLIQSLNYMGKITSLTLSGVQHLIPDYKSTAIHVYLKDVENADFIRDFKAKYGNSIKDIMDIDEVLASQSSVYISAMLSVMVTILAITVLVVALILYLVIKTMILKRKREFGILKATGYTTLQLMTQIVLSFVPVVIAGVLIGGVLGCLCTNAVLTLLLSGAGIYNVQFIVNIPFIVVLCIGLIVLAYLISMLVARRIKGITAYGLITE